MATFHVKTGTTKSAKGGGGKHAQYISGEGRYGHKAEVSYVLDGNIPGWAKDGIDFFEQADKLERANGRSGRKLIIAIPNEAQDKQKWAVELIQSIVKNQPYRLAIHTPADGNPHLHAIFCERKNDLEIPKEAYFTRQNQKLMVQTEIKTNGKKNPEKLKNVQFFAQKSWLKEVRLQTLEKIREVVPTFEIGQGKEIQIGPDRPHATHEQKEARLERMETVQASRAIRAEIKQLEQQIKAPTQPTTTRPEIKNNGKDLDFIDRIAVDSFAASAARATAAEGRQRRTAGLCSLRNKQMVPINSRQRVLLPKHGGYDLSERDNSQLRRLDSRRKTEIVHERALTPKSPDFEHSATPQAHLKMPTIPSLLVLTPKKPSLEGVSAPKPKPRSFGREM